MVKKSINKKKLSVKPTLRKSAKTVKASHAKKVTSKKVGKENTRLRSSSMTAHQMAKSSCPKNGPLQVAHLEVVHSVDELLAHIKELVLSDVTKIVLELRM